MDGQVVTTVIVQEDQWDVINRIKNQFYTIRGCYEDKIKSYNKKINR